MIKLSSCLCAILLVPVLAAQQAPSLGDLGAIVKPAEPVEAPLPDSFPLAQVADKALETVSQLGAMRADLEANRVAALIEAQLPEKALEIVNLDADTTRMLGASPGLEALQSQENTWKELRRVLTTWAGELAARADDLERRDARLALQEKTWGKTREEGRKNDAQKETIDRIDSLLKDIRQCRAEHASASAKVATLQNRVSTSNVRISEAMNAVVQSQKRAFQMLLLQDSPALWDIGWFRGQTLREEGNESIAAQWTATQAYLGKRRNSFVVHGAVLAAIFASLTWVRRRVGQWAAADSSLQSASKVLTMPLPTALVLSFLLAESIYPQAPRLFWAIMAGVALVPTVWLLHRLVDKLLRRLLHALVAFYIYGLLLSVTISLPSLYRILLLVQLVCGIAFCFWFMRQPRTSESDEGRSLRRLARAGVRISLAVMAAALLANVLGFVGFSRFLNSALLESACLAVALNAVISVLDALIGAALHVPPFVRLRMIQRHRLLVRERVRSCLRWLAVVWWLWVSLDAVSLRRGFVTSVEGFLGSTWTVGSVNVSIGGLTGFLVAILLAVFISRLTRFLLEEEVYPRVRLARGIPYAVSTVLHYVILLGGFVLAVAALGYDMTKFTILAGAFGVGLGFGMQNIVNNFVSGLILLFERPLQVGDVIEMDAATGVVTRIGIRASVVRVGNGSEVIVPNAKLISEKFTNWTLSDRKRSLEVSLAVGQEQDPTLVMEMITAAAKTHPLVAESPPAQTFFTEFVTGGARFTLRVWTSRFEDARPLQSDLAVAIHKTMKEKGVTLL